MSRYEEDQELTAALSELLDGLDQIAAQHGELTDTLVREALFDAVYHGFLKPQAGYVVPETLGLYEAAGNLEVQAALQRYVVRAGARADALGWSEPGQRLQAFQAPVVSAEGTSPDEYFGWLESL